MKNKRTRIFFPSSVLSFWSYAPFYAPNFEEVEGAYWFGPVRPSVRLSVCLSVTLFGSSETQEPLMLESWNFIYGIYMKNKRTRIFFPPPVLSFWSYAPFSTMNEQPC